jgi:hypothetical protein
MNSWVGTQNAHQDFALEKSALEVKTSKAGDPFVYISSEHQLDYTSWENLYLCLVAVNESAGKRGTLYDLVTEIKRLLEIDGDLVREFEKKLTFIGITEDTLENYNEVSYSVRYHRFFRVEEGFPLIIRETFKNEAVNNVKYQIDIKKCSSFEIIEEEVLSDIL